jgi:uncharacterized protein GlcG (DUF336 family)
MEVILHRRTAEIDGGFTLVAGGKVVGAIGVSGGTATLWFC